MGLGLAYHMAIIYTDGAGRSFGASSGPSASATAQTPALALRAIYASAENRPSAYGTLLSDPKNNHMFIKGHPEDYYTQDFEGMEYPSCRRGDGARSLRAMDGDPGELRDDRRDASDLLADQPEFQQHGRYRAAQRRPRDPVLRRDEIRARRVHEAAARRRGDGSACALTTPIGATTS